MHVILAYYLSLRLILIGRSIWLTVDKWITSLLHVSQYMGRERYHFLIAMQEGNTPALDCVRPDLLFLSETDNCSCRQGVKCFCVNICFSSVLFVLCCIIKPKRQDRLLFYLALLLQAWVCGYIQYCHTAWSNTFFFLISTFFLFDTHF